MARIARVVLLASALTQWTADCVFADDRNDYAEQRRQLMQEVADLMRRTSSETRLTALSPAVQSAMESVPRHQFVPPEQQRYAYKNRPLPIGYGQTISQPYIVALMTELLQVSDGDKVLEIGTGSGYQAAILARLTDAVYTIEIIEALAQRAAMTLKAQGYSGVQLKFGDGYYGWEEHAPFDAIVVTAAASHVPPPLIRQLKPGGRMVIPLGSSFLTQQLVLVEKNTQGKVLTRGILPVAFVPLTGGH